MSEPQMDASEVGGDARTTATRGYRGWFYLVEFLGHGDRLGANER